MGIGGGTRRFCIPSTETCWTIFTLKIIQSVQSWCSDKQILQLSGIVERSISLHVFRLTAAVYVNSCISVIFPTDLNLRLWRKIPVLMPDQRTSHFGFCRCCSVIVPQWVTRQALTSHGFVCKSNRFLVQFLYWQFLNRNLALSLAILWPSINLWSYNLISFWPDMFARKPLPKIWVRCWS